MYPNGIDYVLVNGTIVVDQQKHTGAKPGVALYGPGHVNRPRGGTMTRLLRSLLLVAPLLPLVREASAQNSNSPADYAQVIAALQAGINREMKIHNLPSVAIALVDNQNTVWAQGLRL